jgi:hypothetical protein
VLAFIDNFVIPFLNNLYGAVGYLGVYRKVKTRDLARAVLVTDSTRQALDPARKVALTSCGAHPLKGFEAPIDVWAVDC